MYVPNFKNKVAVHKTRKKKAEKYWRVSHPRLNTRTGIPYAVPTARQVGFRAAENKSSRDRGGILVLCIIPEMKNLL